VREPGGAYAAAVSFRSTDRRRRGRNVRGALQEVL